MGMLLLPLIVGVVVSRFVDFSPLLLLAAFVSAIALLLFWRSTASLGLLFVGFGYCLASFEKTAPTLPAQSDAVVALIASSQRHATLVALRQADGAWRESAEKILLSGVEVPCHRTVVVRGDVSVVDGASNSYSALAVSKGYLRSVAIEKLLYVDAQQSRPLSARLNDWGFARLEKLGLQPQTLASVAAMTLARRDLLDSGLVRSYNYIGASHLLALSGLHLSIVIIIISSITFLLPLVNRGHFIADLLAIVAVWLFAVMAGLGESVVRAAWMFSIMNTSRLVSRGYNALNSLFTSALLILCCDPVALYDVGFQLSFTAVGAIIMVGAPLCWRLRTQSIIANMALSSLIISIVATLATAPIVLYYFGHVGILSPVVTPLLVVTLTVILLLSMIWILLPLPFAAPFVGWVVEEAVALQNGVVEWFASWGVG